MRVIALMQNLRLKELKETDDEILYPVPVCDLDPCVRHKPCHCNSVQPPERGTIGHRLGRILVAQYSEVEGS